MFNNETTPLSRTNIKYETINDVESNNTNIYLSNYINVIYNYVIFACILIYCICIPIVICLVIFLFQDSITNSIYQNHVSNIVTVTITSYDRSNCHNNGAYIIGITTDKTLYYPICRVNDECIDSELILEQYPIDKVIDVYYSGTSRGCMNVKDYDDACKTFFNAQIILFMTSTVVIIGSYVMQVYDR